MAFYSGKVKMNELYATLIGHLKTVAEGAWTVHFENANMLVIKSVGSSGTEKMFMKIEPGTSKSTTGYTIVITGNNDASATDGTMVAATSSVKTIRLHMSAVDSNLLIDYHLSVTLDRILLWTSGDISSATGKSVMTYIGILNRYSVEPDTTNAFSVGMSYLNPEDGIRAVKDATGVQTNNNYKAYSTVLTANPGWGNLYSLFPIVLANAVEGARGEYIDIYHVATPGVNHGDEITAGGKVYKVYVLSASGNFPIFPTEKIAVQMV